MTRDIRPWPALWALLIGFFMILVDSTIVNIANPAIMEHFDAGITEVIWVTSAYLLSYAVLLLLAGRLGDRFGPKTLFLTGLVVFTIASAWCGLADSITMLIVARVVQGIGGALLTPQSMAIITRIFPPQQRGAAMGIWGAAAGVALLVGPLAGGLLVDSLGWEWIFFVNLPVGVIGFILAWTYVPKLETHPHRFDWIGVALSAVGMFLLVFGIQEGETYDWGTITGPITVWGMIASGLVVMTLFIVWQARNRSEPLLPLGLFRDRNFAIANGAISMMGMVVSSMVIPLIFFTQIVLGYSPTNSALILLPMALLVMPLSPVFGKLIGRYNPKWFVLAGFVIFAISLYVYSLTFQPGQSWAILLIPSAIMGVGQAAIWGPLGTIATRNLPMHQAGAGSGIYNTTRQIGAVIGSAAISALITARLTANIPGYTEASAQHSTGALPDMVAQPFADAMAQALWLPIIAVSLAAVLSLFLEKPKPVAWGAPAEAAAAAH
ncbi:MAG TPA: DHA2 family efflux MFS transporter permease subunit [Microbacteriaceae bacterium]|nr:DHA2 family efflux MFS transporter permease subunit [Microbacteriaceae bacterium]